ncbi:MAG: Fatty acid hydroxylase-like protein [Acidimicrobiales bacterium]|nr:Fatty acid hydroxylase-like protein [Acidimicrobiales bacterium]
MTGVGIVGGFVAGFFLWGFAEYLLHRFAMHHLRGKGMMSREHLEHHVRASWTWSSVFLLSWSGMLLVGFALWAPLGWALVDTWFGLSVAIGWTAGYFFYEYQHAMAHLQAPKGRYGTWLRHHHFHHHFGHPMANHGVSWPLWDHVFGTFEDPGLVRVPRRLAMTWLVDDDGEILPEYADRYALVGRAATDERLAALDRARAFASVAPTE